MYICKIPAANVTVVADSETTAVIDHETGNHAVMATHGANTAPRIFEEYCRELDADETFRAKIKALINDNWNL